MRTLRIDFTAENMLPDGEYAGRIGEHNATDLIITPPAEMAECEEIINYVAAFVTEGKIIRSDFYPKADTVTVSLCSQLTQDHTLGVQLEGYDGKGGLVVKSAIISELKLLPSAGGDETDFDGECGGIVSQINLNTLARHEHTNKKVLDSIGESEGMLTYNGAAITAQQQNIVAEFDVMNGDASVEISSSTILFSTMSSDDSPIKDGTNIVSVEFSTAEEEGWIDIMSIMKYDISVPVCSQTFRAFDIDGFIYIALVQFVAGGRNKFMDYVTNYQIEKLRVTFTAGNGS